jgi:molybdopterin converting factor subunit 1
MNISLRYFAAFRETTGRSEETLALQDAATIADARARLLAQYPRLHGLMDRAVCAVNHRYVPLDTMLREGDELAFIPPVGGGEGFEPVVLITREPLDRAALVGEVADAGVGGIVVFEGVVRDNARGKQVRYLEYDVYPEMASAQLRAIVAEAKQRWGVERVAVAHRVGRLEIGEASVIIVVASPHRAEAFDACRYIIDTLKTTVPIWKKEVATNGEEWVEE